MKMRVLIYRQAAALQGGFATKSDREETGGPGDAGRLSHIIVNSAFLVLLMPELVILFRHHYDLIKSEWNTGGLRAAAVAPRGARTNMGARLHAETGHELSARQEEILTIVHHQGFATIDALARHFDVSTQTIRRDIIYLDEQQLLQRFHGGAGVRETTVRLGYAEKRVTAAEAKERIARLAAALIKPGETVFLDVGTTVEAVARALRGRGGLKVFTSSLASATILSAEQEAEVFVTGGVLRGPDGSLTDEWAREAVSRFRFDVAILGFSGIDDDGALMDFDLGKVAVKQAVATRASRIIAVGESAKLLRPAIVRVLDADRIDTLVTNEEPPQLVAETLGKANVEVLFPPA